MGAFRHTLKGFAKWRARARGLLRRPAARTLSLAHSADADDAFMFQPLLSGGVSAVPFRSVVSDIETLNRSAARGAYDVTALSLAAYASVGGLYRPLSAGASVGDGYGPVVVSRKPLATLRRRAVAVPGLRTTASLLLRLREPACQPVVMPFDRILGAVRSGAVGAGVLIHEGQITYLDHGLFRVLDLGAWWKDLTGLVAVLGIVAARRSLGSRTLRTVQRALRESVRRALARPRPALRAAAAFSRGVGPEKTRRFVAMYVNSWTVDLGETGRRSARALLDLAYGRRLVDRPPALDFVS